ncbi:MAG: phosphopantothenoylcysteine decarboxylase [Armatimonadota bacterium]|nr:phosphopantothenoylcysteine decarboxylase [Armatimonadota bacterium]MDR5696381.1 phosphopantothenoylcysteine decarboxylase [Armatimonadota bacterium]
MPLRGKRVLVTSGPTRAPLDAVRYITNKSSGRLGSLIAEMAVQAGASVTFVYGRGSQLPQIRARGRDHLRLVPIETVDDLVNVFRDELPSGYDAVVHPMAVLDFAPAQAHRDKVASEEEWVVRLVPTPKAIRLVKEISPRTFLVGFKLEVGKTPEDLVASVREWKRKNDCDVVVANDLREIESGVHRGYFIGPEGELLRIAEGKEEIARAVIEILDRA